MFQFIIKTLFPNAIPVFYQHSTKLEIYAKNKGCVVLLGWEGSKQRHLKKIASFYNDHAIDCIAMTMPFLVPGFIRDTIENILANEIRKRVRVQDKVICHIMSNSGSWVYASLMKRNLIPKPKLLIWDSAPFIYVKSSLIQEASLISRPVVSIILNQPIYEHYLLTPLVVVSFIFTLAISRFIKSIQGSVHITPDLIELHDYMIHRSPVIPSIFVYSKGDILVPVSEIDKFIAQLHLREFPVDRKLFDEDVAHTSSFYVKPLEFKEFVFYTLMCQQRKT